MKYVLLGFLLFGCSRSDTPSPSEAESATPVGYAQTKGAMKLVIDGKPLEADVSVATTKRHALQIVTAPDETRAVEILLNLPLHEGSYPVVTTGAFVGLDGGSRTANAMVMYTEGHRGEAIWAGTSGSVDVAFGKGEGMIVTLKDIVLAPRTYPPGTNEAKGTRALSGTVDSSRLPVR